MATNAAKAIDSIEAALQPCPDTAANEISMQSVLGIFLTLVLCLLTQPYGSLLYRPPSPHNGSLPRFIYSLWRLNPLVCAAEAIVIAYCLGCAVYAAKADSALPRLSLTLRYPFFYDAKNERNRRWERHLHINAAALLLLRANDYPSQQTRHSGAAERLLASVLVEEQQTRSTSLHQNQQPQDMEENGFEMQPVPVPVPSAGAVAAPIRSLDALRTRNSDNVLTRTNVASVLPPEPGLLRRRTTLAEAGQATEDSFTRDLRKILGSNVLAREDSMVDFFTVVSVGILVIKLTATTLPWTVRVPAIFYILGWAAVQELLVLFHRCELEDHDMLQIVLTARRHTNNMDSRLVFLGIMLFAIVPCGYVAYQASFQSGLSLIRLQPKNMWIPIFQLPIFLFEGMLYNAMPLVPIVAVFAVVRFLWPHPLINTACLFLGFGGWASIVFWLYREPFNLDNFLLTITSLITFVIALVILLVLVPREGRYRTSSWFGYVSVGASILLTAYTFILFSLSYDPAGTYKPIWLEILG